MNPALDLFFRRSDSPSDIQEHMPTLFHAARGLILELGVGEGRSTAAFLAGIEAHGGCLVSVDNRDVGHVAPQISGWRFVNVDSLNIDAIWPNMCSNQVCDRVGVEHGGLGSGIPCQVIDVLFIDTDHTYDRTLKELQLWGQYVRPGGTILLHDTRSHEGVMPAILEYCRQTGLSCREQPNNNGLGHIYIPRNDQ